MSPGEIIVGAVAAGVVLGLTLSLFSIVTYWLERG